MDNILCRCYSIDNQMLVLFISGVVIGVLLFVLYQLVFDDNDKERLTRLQKKIVNLLEKYDSK